MVSKAATKELKSALHRLYPDAKEVVVTRSARVGFYLYLKSLNLPPGSEVIMPGFTCAAIVNPVLWLGLKPVYVDIDPTTLALDFERVRERVEADHEGRIRVIMLQHSFGYNAEVEQIVEFARSRDIRLVEDCAHALGVNAVHGSADVIGGRLGSFGDAALASFGLEKILPTRFGGALLVNSFAGLPDSDGDRIDQSEIVPINWVEILYWRINSLVWRFCSLFGRRSPEIARFLSRFGIVDFGLSERDKRGLKPLELTGLPEFQARIILKKLEDLQENLNHRKNISQIYYNLLRDVSNLTFIGRDVENLPFVRFPVLLSNKSLRKGLSTRYSIWYSPNIYPSWADTKAMGYRKGDCPVAEDVAGRIFNLPTSLRISDEEARELALDLKSRVESAS